VNILQALDDPKVFAPFFRGNTWQSWRVFLAALFALPMTPEQLELYRQHTGRTLPPTTPHYEAWLVVGRRGGKSFALSVIASFLAAFHDWRPYLGPGERGTVMIIARDRRQARVIKRFITGLLHETPMLKRTIEAETQDAIQLKNRVSIEIHTASFRSTRGYTVVAALLDELAFWETDDGSAEPDSEVINAIRPAMATIPNAMLLCASSPYARKGALWDAYRKHFGRDDDSVLVWQAETRQMNASVPQSYIDQHLSVDPQRAAAEYLAQFRTDIEAFVPRETIEAAIIPGRREVLPMNGVDYIACVDPSGGTADPMTLAIAHRDCDGRAVLDAERERAPPFSPEAVVVEFAALCKSYGIKKVIGDRVGGEFCRELFRSHGIEYELADKPKSDIYRDLLPSFNSGEIELLDNQRIVTQFCNLERRTVRGGRESIDHMPGAHDDLSNAAAGALLLASRAVPALWQPDSFLVRNAPVPMPPRALVAYAVVLAGEHDIAVAYFGKGRILGTELIILDIDLLPLAPTVFATILGHLRDLAGRVSAVAAFVYSTASVAHEFARIGVQAEIVDALVIKEELPFLTVAAAGFVGAGKVKFTAEALTKSETLPGGILSPGASPDDVLRVAVIAGTVLGLDEHRNLIPSRPKRASVNANRR
jgi:hypothetical protein